MRAPPNERCDAQSVSATPTELFEHARATAAARGTDPELIWTLMVVENLQRPPWFRAIERRVGRFLPVRTTGLVQTASDSTVSDAESITLAIDGHLADVSVPMNEHGYRDWSALKEVFMRHNPSTDYGELCCTAFDELEGYFQKRLGQR